MGFIRDIGALTKSYTALTPAVITAAAGNDNSELTGITVDRLLAGRGFAHSAKLVISFVTSVNTSETLSVTANAEHGAASNMGDTADYSATRAQYDMSSSATITPITLVSGAVPKTAVAAGSISAAAGQVEIDFDLSSAKQYIRAMVTFDLSRSGTDTVAYSATWILGGFAVVPPTTN